MALALACGPQAPVDSATDTGGSSTGAGTSGTSGTSTGPTPSTTADPSTSTTADPSTSTDAVTSSDSTVGFIQRPDHGGGGGTCPENVARKRCDPWVQDCPFGEKCIAYDGSCDGRQESLRCSEIAPDPAVAGEPCLVEDRPASGRDNCDLESMCWNVDPDTLQGTCVAFCDGTVDAPLCPPGTACAIEFDGTILLCLPTCDPLLPNCAPGEVCVDTGAFDSRFVCTRAVPVPVELHQPCDRFDACAPGLFCAFPKPAACEPGPASCCVGFCDITLQDCPAPQQCLSWFDEQPPPGLENVGRCAD